MDKKSRTVLSSVSPNALPLAVKPVVGVLTGSASVLSEAIHSSTDLVVSIGAFVAVRRSNSPTEEESSVLEGFIGGEIENDCGIREESRMAWRRGYAATRRARAFLYT